jgi:excisionase family DNA binding protein
MEEESLSGFCFEVSLSAEQLDALAERVADKLERRRDGYLDADAAADFLCCSRKAIYHLVERRRLPCHRVGGRLFFDRAELRAWVGRGG